MPASAQSFILPLSAISFARVPQVTSYYSTRLLIRWSVKQTFRGQESTHSTSRFQILIYCLNAANSMESSCRSRLLSLLQYAHHAMSIALRPLLTSAAISIGKKIGNCASEAGPPSSRDLCVSISRPASISSLPRGSCEGLGQTDSKGWERDVKPESVPEDREITA